jgi:hypothetical protein
MKTNWMQWAVGFFLAWNLAALATDFCLYADGAHEFLQVLEARDTVPLWWSRHFVYDINQFPLMAAIKLGVTNLPALRLMYGIGLFLPWPLALWLCHRISRENFWLAVVGCAAGYLNGAYMPCGQHILSHALFWPALFALLFARPLKPFTAVILLVMAISLQFAYESQTFLCVPLLTLALYRAWQERKEKRSLAALVFLIAAGLFLLSILNGLFSLKMPEIPVNLDGFRNNTRRLLHHPGWTVGWTLVWGGTLVAALRSESFLHALGRRGGFFLLAGVVLIWGSEPLWASHPIDTGLQYDHRAMNLFVPLALVPIGLILAFRPAWLVKWRPAIIRFATVILIAQSLWHLSCAVLWYRDVRELRQILATRQGLVSLNTTALAGKGMLGREFDSSFIGGRFDWAWLLLSIALTPQKNVQCLISSDLYMDPIKWRTCWMPKADPFRPEKLPDLQYYGINYTNYAAALRRQRLN